MMNKLLTIATLTLITVLLTSCGSDTENHSGKADQVNLNKQTAVLLKDSKLTKFMQEDSVCNALSIETIKKIFNVNAEIKIQPSTSRYSTGVTCNYSWDRPDAEERKQKLLMSITEQMQKNARKIPMREKVLESNISIKIEEFKGNPNHFMPAKLTEEQLQKQIADAQKRANDRLTDSQKKLAGDAANSMMEKMLRQNNNNEQVAGVGDKAYWSSVGGGGLNVLSGNAKLFISLMVADTDEEDKENTKMIAQLLLN